MGLTSIATGDNKTRKLWDAKSIKEVRRALFWDQFFSTDQDNVIYEKTDLEKEPGDNITIDIVRRLTGTATVGEATLKGNEEAMSFDDDSVSVDLYRHAVRHAGPLTEQRYVNLRSKTRRALSNWMAEDIDARIFTAMEASPTQVFRPGSATSLATLTASDLLDINTIRRAKTWAGVNATIYFEPVSLGGGIDMFMLVVHPEQAFDLREDAGFEQILRDTFPRSVEDHPIRTGALGMIDGVMLYESHRVATAANGGSGSNLDVANATFCGKNAGCFAWFMRPNIVETDEDYGSQFAAAVQAGYGFVKVTWTSASVDHAMAQVQTVRTSIT